MTGTARLVSKTLTNITAQSVSSQIVPTSFDMKLVATLLRSSRSLTPQITLSPFRSTFGATERKIFCSMLKLVISFSSITLKWTSIKNLFKQRRPIRLRTLTLDYSVVTPKFQTIVQSIKKSASMMRMVKYYPP